MRSQFAFTVISVFSTLNILLAIYVFIGELPTSALSKLTIAVMKHHNQKQVGEERAYLAYTSTSQFITKEVRKGTQGRSLNSGTDAETMEEHCLLVYSL